VNANGDWGWDSVTEFGPEGTRELSRTKNLLKERKSAGGENENEK
jgi:hypothetical protein